MSKRTTNISKNLIWGILSKLLALCLPFATRTVIIHTLGINYVGLGSLFNSLLHVLNFADLGIGGAIVFSMYKPMAEGKTEKICALLNFYKVAYRRIGTIILLFGLLALSFLKNLIAGDVPQGINIYVLFVIYLLNDILGYLLFAYRQALFTASQKVHVISKISLFVQLSQNILQIVVLLIFKNFYYYVLLLPICTVINSLLIYILSIHEFPNFTAKGILEKSEIQEIKKKVRGMVFQKIGNMILTSADTIVISSFLGLSVLGIYNSYYYVISFLSGLLLVVQQAIIPSIGNSMVEASKNKNLKNFKLINFIYMWILCVFCSCMLGLYQPFIKLWQGKINMLSNDMVILLVIYFFCLKMNDVCWMYKEAAGLWWESKYIPIVSSVLNLGINIVLVQRIGLYGIVISTIISLLLVNFPFTTKIVFKKYFNSSKDMAKYCLRILYFFVCMIISCILVFFVSKHIVADSIVSLLIKGALCFVLSNLVLLLLNFWFEDFRKSISVLINLVQVKIK